MYRVQSVTLHYDRSILMGFVGLPEYTTIISFSAINHLVFVMDTCFL
jgi:hypothetical protein